jgi:hypothetical protein
MNGPVTETQWYIARDGKQHGPLTDVEMRTFVAHSYLRPTDLIWRPGMPEWTPATQVFPAVFPASAPAPAPIAPQPGTQGANPSANQSAPASLAPPSDFDSGEAEDARRPRSVARKLVTAAAVMTVIGGGAFALATYREPLLQLVTGAPVAKFETPPETNAEAPTGEPSPDDAAQIAPPSTADTMAGDASVPAATDGAAAPPEPETETALLTLPEAPAAPPSIEGSQIDARLQQIPVWATLKSDYPDWYVGYIAAAEKMVADKRPESDVSTHLTQGLVTLRRQNADKALMASPDKLRGVASAFLENLKSLRSQSVSACYGFISKGESSPAIVQMMQTPESATAFNAHIGAVFDAIADGAKTPTKHDVAIKSDYDILIKELAKIGWKEDDLKTFSNPRLLSKQPPEQVCNMVLDWFVAHLAIKDKAVQDRLLYETLKPVVSG